MHHKENVLNFLIYVQKSNFGKIKECSTIILSSHVLIFSTPKAFPKIYYYNNISLPLAFAFSFFNHSIF